MSVDRNQTVWQRLNDVLRDKGYAGRELDELQATLHKHVLAEREDARRSLAGLSVHVPPGHVVINGIQHPMPPPAAPPMSDRAMYVHLARKGMTR